MVYVPSASVVLNQWHIFLMKQFKRFGRKRKLYQVMTPINSVRTNARLGLEEKFMETEEVIMAGK